MKDRIGIFAIVLISILLIACGGREQPIQAENTYTLSPSVEQNTLQPDASANQPKLEITLTYEKQSGHASNQFAIWVEDAQGAHVKTLFATSFTAKGGWEKRELSLPDWVQSFDIANADDAAIDSVSGATPASGGQRYTWDCTDSSGNPVPEGVYKIIVEATLRDENRVLYQAEIDTSGEAQSVLPEPEYFGESEAERGMLTGVSVVYTP